MLMHFSIRAKVAFGLLGFAMLMAWFGLLDLLMQLDQSVSGYAVFGIFAAGFIAILVCGWLDGAWDRQVGAVESDGSAGSSSSRRLSD